MGRNARFSGRGSRMNFRRLVDHNIVRLVDLLFVHRDDDDGSIEKMS